jgi:hypothetical protein
MCWAVQPLHLTMCTSCASTEPAVLQLLRAEQALKELQLSIPLQLTILQQPLCT